IIYERTCLGTETITLVSQADPGSFVSTMVRDADDGNWIRVDHSDGDALRSRTLLFTSRLFSRQIPLSLISKMIESLSSLTLIDNFHLPFMLYSPYRIAFSTKGWINNGGI